MARPIKTVDFKLLENLAQFPFKQEDLASLLSVSLDTLEKRVNEEYEESLAEFLRKKGAKTKALLYQKQIEIALKGNVTMLIWLGKQYLDQKEKHETTIGNNKDSENKFEPFQLIINAPKT